MCCGRSGAQIAIRQTDGTGVGAVIGTQGGGWNALGFWGVDRFPTNSPDLRIFSTGIVRTSGNFIVDGNALINTTIDSGFKLDVNGTGRFSSNLTVSGSATNSLLVKGSGNTSSTTSLLVQNSTGTQGIAVRDDGVKITNEIRPSYININNIS